MQPIQPDQAVFLLNGVYLPSLKNEQRITRSIIEAIPLDKGDYRPDEISKSALDLAWHIVVTEMRFMDAVAAGAFDFSPRPLPDSVKTSGDLAAWYTDNFAAAIRSADETVERAVAEDHRFPRHVPVARGDVLELPAASLDPPSRTVVDVSAADGCESAIDLRRKLRRRRGSQGGAAEGLTSILKPQ